jgi:hypothetical protein
MYTSAPVFSIDEKTLRIFPNPAEDYLNIDSPFSTNNIQTMIFNASGALVFAGYLDQGKQLDISSLKPGIYFIRSDHVDGRSILTGKFIKF